MENGAATRRGGRLHAVVRRALQPSSTWPLRVKLVAAVLLLVAVGLTITGAAAVTALRTYLYAKVDSGLHTTARSTVAAIENGGWEAGPVTQTRLPSTYWIARTDVTGRTGRTLSSIMGESRFPPELPVYDTEQVRQLGGEPFDLGSTDGTRWRVVMLPLSDGSGNVVVAASLAGTDATIARLVGIIVVVGGGVLVLVGALGYVLVRSSLRPLVEVESTAAAIAAGDLSQRVPEQDPRTEVGRLSGALNSMLTQVEDAFRARESSEAAARESEGRMRQFVADASHELRTPLTSIRGFSELYRQGAVGDADDIARLMRRIEDEATRMGLLVDDLLLLARLDQERPMEREPVDLVALARDAVGDAAAIAPERDIGLETEAGEGVLVTGDEARLRQVLGNLVGNALTHTEADTPIVVRIGDDPHDGRYVRLDVSDEGPGLSREAARRVFERFYRVDPSRSRAAGGTGLGLSIVAAIVAGHGGRVGVETAPGKGATFQVRLPRRAP
ncbi:MAG: HAMP domain-containing protein [Streptosporangiales bacterium]|nr:HAMP domain-containing protein [Streptosporangiales bacterium]